MCVQRDRFQRIITAIHLEHGGSRTDEVIIRLTGIVCINARRGRLGELLDAERDCELEVYLRRMWHIYDQHNVTVDELQQERHSARWDSFYKEVQGWVHDYLFSRGFMPNEGTARLAQNYTSFVVEQLLTAHFPYDIQFERWARTVAQNVCRKQMSCDMRQKYIPDKLLVGLEQWGAHAGSLRGTEEEQLMKLDLRNELQGALQELPAASRVVIQLRYFAGMDYVDIALTLGRTVKAVYNLNFKGIKRLREILTVKGYNTVHDSKQPIRRNSRQSGPPARPIGDNTTE